MFDLSHVRYIYTWDHVFLLVSMERAAVFLEDLAFPPALLPHLDSLRQLARPFNRRSHDLDWHSINKLNSTEGRQLFEETHARIIEAIGADATELFIEWGNRLVHEFDRSDPQSSKNKVQEEIEFKVLRKLFLDKSAATLLLPEALRHKTVILQAIIARGIGEFHGFDEAVDFVEEFARTSWEHEAYHFYNPDRDLYPDSPEKSPLDYVSNYVADKLINDVFCRIKRLLTPAELDILIAWIAEQLPDKTAGDIAEAFDD